MDNNTPMYFYDFLDLIKVNLDLKRYFRQDGFARYTACISRCEIKRGATLSGDYGVGIDFPSAIIDYIEKIKGKDIIIGAMSERRIYSVPHVLNI